MRIIGLFFVGILGISSMMLGISLYVWNSAFADIFFDSQSETQWYNGSDSRAMISAIPDALPIPVDIIISIRQTRHSH